VFHLLGSPKVITSAGILKLVHIPVIMFETL
jgi:hypothetical protein